MIAGGLVIVNESNADLFRKTVLRAFMKNRSTSKRAMALEAGQKNLLLSDQEMTGPETGIFS